MIKICKRCYEKFSTNHHNKKYCSEKCSLDLQLLKCIKCNKSFCRAKHLVNKQKKIFCSQECYFKYPRPKGRRKYKRYVTSIGYAFITNSEVANYSEHRYVMEKHLGRKLLSKEVIHHINLVKDDNRIENLLLFNDVSSHLSFHRQLEKKIKIKEITNGRVKYEEIYKA